ncbi:MAG TPA: amidase [Acidimicrobiales bacterium]|nr:amidase [Acidimicrobiales bacterium]
MATWIERLDTYGSGLRVAVKDAIDVEGVRTTAGCPAVAAGAGPAASDAACLVGFRAAGARLVGKANLHELCFGTSGINPWFGTPVNPLDAALVPGGSSSGSAVAVATGEADVALGTDTGGSVRIPAACCGVVGLKTTWGRIPLAGVWPLSAALDTVGPLAPDVAAAARGMALLDPSFDAAGTAPASIVGRVRPYGVSVDPLVDAAVDRALAAAEVEVVELPLAGWHGAYEAFVSIITREAWEADRHLLDHRDGISPGVAERIERGASIGDAEAAAARRVQRTWQEELDAAFRRVEVLVLPTLSGPPPPLDDPLRIVLNALTAPFNVSGTPALSLPVPTGGRVPASLQIVGPRGREDLLCATGSRIEGAVAGRI